MPKARSSWRATPASDSPGLSGVEKPMTPESRTTGTTGMSPRSRFGNQRPQRLARAGQELLQMLRHALLGHELVSSL